MFGLAELRDEFFAVPFREPDGGAEQSRSYSARHNAAGDDEQLYAVDVAFFDEEQTDLSAVAVSVGERRDKEDVPVRIDEGFKLVVVVGVARGVLLVRSHCQLVDAL